MKARFQDEGYPLAPSAVRSAMLRANPVRTRADLVVVTPSPSIWREAGETATPGSAWRKSTDRGLGEILPMVRLRGSRAEASHQSGFNRPEKWADSRFLLDCLDRNLQCEKRQMVQWQLQEAKNRFSEVVQRAKREGPQTITLRGERAAVILSSADYDRLTQGRPSLVDDLLAGPSFDDDLVRVIARRAERPSRDVLLRCISSIRISSPKPGAAQRRPCPGFAPSTRLAFFSASSPLVR